MKKKISKIFALALTAIFIISACSACNEGTTQDDQPQNSGAQGNSGQENTKSSTGGGSGQNSTENGTGGSSEQGSTGGTESELKDVSLRVVIYSNTKADFIIENAVLEPGSGDRIKIGFGTEDGYFSVEKGTDEDCFLGQSNDDSHDDFYRAGDYTYSYNGEQLTIMVDMGMQGIPFHFRQVEQYDLTYYYSLNGERRFKEFSFAAADIVKDEGSALSLTCSLQVIHDSKKSAQFIVDNAPLAHGSNDIYQVIFSTKDGTYCEQVRDFGEEYFSKTLCKSVNANNTEFEVINGDYGNTTYFKTDGDRLVINVKLGNLDFDLNEVQEFTVRYLKNNGYDGQAEITFAAADVRTAPLECFKYDDDGNGGIIITNFDSGPEDVYIPKKIDGKPVTAIGENAFDYARCKNVVIYDNITKIDRGAFLKSEIESLTIYADNTEMEISQSAFYHCKKLTELTIFGGKTVIDEEAFSECGLVNVNLDVKFIGKQAFYLNDNLANVNIKAETIGEKAFANVFTDNLSERKSFGAVISAETIGKRAFEYSGIKDLTFMDGVREIGEEAFKDCRLLTDFTFPDSVTVLGSGAFSYCHSLTNVIYPKNITVINDAFYRCLSVVSVTFPQTVTEIGNGAFGWWRSITDIRIPDGCTCIGVNAFETCDSLSSVYVPDSVKEIGGGAFYSCTKLKTITLPKGVKLQGGEKSVFRFSPTKVTYR